MSEVVCPICHQSVAVPEQYVGKNWSCPACKHRFVPEPGGSDAEAEAPPPSAGETTPRRRFTGTVVFWAFALGAALGAALTFLLGPR